MPPRAWRILIVDDHAIVRRGLLALLGDEPDLEICAQAATHDEGIAAVASSRPDLVVTDLSLLDGDALAMVEEIRALYPALPILVLSMHDSHSWVGKAFQAGASGYVTKQEMGEELLIAIRRVLAGEKYSSPRIRGTSKEA